MKKFFLLSMFFIYTIGFGRVKMYIIFSNSHKYLFENYFLPSFNLHLKEDFELIKKNMEQVCNKGTFFYRGWNAAMIKKVECILEAINENWNSYFVYSDVDIQFFSSFKNYITNNLNDKDLLIQYGDPKIKSICAGFFVCRANDRTKTLWLNVKEDMVRNSKLDDQTPLFERLQSRSLDLNWDFLPIEFYNPFKMWKPRNVLNVPKNIVLHHACWTIGIHNKIQQLNYVKKLVRGVR